MLNNKKAHSLPYLILLSRLVKLRNILRVPMNLFKRTVPLDVQKFDSCVSLMSVTSVSINGSGCVSWSLMYSTKYSYDFGSKIILKLRDFSATYYINITRGKLQLGRSQFDVCCQQSLTNNYSSSSCATARVYIPDEFGTFVSSVLGI